MKHIINIYKAACLTGLLALSTTSCTDWLTIYPQDRVVEENFWEDKSDLEGVRYGAYRQMASTVSKFAVWGDLRSDELLHNVDDVAHVDLRVTVRVPEDSEGHGVLRAADCGAGTEDRSNIVHGVSGGVTHREGGLPEKI